jgi:hypothetical protein
MKTMSLNVRSQVVRSLLFTAALLALAALPFGNAPTSRARDLGPQDFLAQYPGMDIGGQQEPDIQVPDEFGDMPQPGRRARSRSAITKKARLATAKGAADATEKTNKGAPDAPPEQVRRNQLARMSPKERDQKVDAAGRDRWKQTNPKLTPEITSGEHFVLFSNLPKDRVANAIKFAETQHSQLKRLLGAPATDWGEKVSLYVFNARKDFIEFARRIENREVDASVSSSGHLTVPQPYIVVVDPLAGKKEEPAASRRKPRGKRGDEKEAPAGPDRTLAGLLAETLGEKAVAAQGKSPRWLAYGVGAFLSSQAEPRSPYYQKLRDLAREKFSQGWTSKATEALGEGDQVSAEEIRAVGFAMVEFLTTEFRGSFPAFAQGMSKGKEKLDDVLKEVYRADHEEFLNQSGSWVALRYGQDQ